MHQNNNNISNNIFRNFKNKTLSTISDIKTMINILMMMMMMKGKSGNNYNDTIYNSSLPYSTTTNSSYSRIILALKNYSLE